MKQTAIQEIWLIYAHLGRSLLPLALCVRFGDFGEVQEIHAERSLFSPVFYTMSMSSYMFSHDFPMVFPMDFLEKKPAHSVGFLGLFDSAQVEVWDMLHPLVRLKGTSLQQAG